MMSKEPPPSPRNPKIYQFVRAGLGRAEVQHNDQCQASSYKLESNGLCKAHDPMECHLTGSTETLCTLNCWNLCNFTPDDQFNLV